MILDGYLEDFFYLFEIVFEYFFVFILVCCSGCLNYGFFDGYLEFVCFDGVGYGFLNLCLGKK